MLLFFYSEMRSFLFPRCGIIFSSALIVIGLFFLFIFPSIFQFLANKVKQHFSKVFRYLRYIRLYKVKDGHKVFSKVALILWRKVVKRYRLYCSNFSLFDPILFSKNHLRQRWNMIKGTIKLIVKRSKTTGLITGTARDQLTKDHWQVLKKRDSVC